MLSQLAQHRLGPRLSFSWLWESHSYSARGSFMLNYCLSWVFWFDSMKKNRVTTRTPKWSSKCFVCLQHRAQTRCSLVQACTSPPHTDWSWMLAEAQSSPSRIGLAVLDLLWSRWPWSHSNEVSHLSTGEGRGKFFWNIHLLWKG